jgi:Fe-S-cluster containining protein
VTEPEIYYFEWRWADDEVIQWQRDGDCNGCGACCKTLIQFTMSRAYLPPVNDFSDWLPNNGGVISARVGIGVQVMINGKSRYFDNIQIIPNDPNHKPCGYLTADNRCRVHAGKNRLCAMWPMTPTHAAAFEECSYTFTEIGRWKISELEAQDATEPQSV